ncbi:Stk1 family PASTA domain-containing Ser/Thr kinase [Bacillus taeanensis]|uniref:Serine/threonine-protein kinase PrkC n=1 Tax=Bacillus taeanensis TaxID=273032 RepID=A0A366XMC4_9BACI|nr:Stk1 family PASTA domain-containing Ser/Thr kinase [Bacillus taeanensis]RBW67510.1 Stk1 family PASTA domain-containing Ser/Thr kinase [Bacillus taeanensis]
MIGKRINDRYKLLKRIGDGGMAIVYQAHDLILDRIVAVKILRSEFSNDEQFIKRFHREAESATSLDHSNIVSIYDVGEEEDTYFIVMEYVEGKTLKDLIKEQGRIPVEESLAIMKQITSAIAHAHEHHIIHRDIKPHNILLNTEGEAKVTDFGIAMAMTSATITHTNSVLGSVHYFSPEQARGGITNEKSDIYSLGIVLYEMVTGELPFSGESPVTVALKHLQEEVKSPKALNPIIPQSVENIIYKALAKDPFHRYGSVYEMEEDINTALSPSRIEEPKYEPPSDDEEATKVLTPISPKMSVHSEAQTKPAQVEKRDIKKQESSSEGKPKLSTKPWKRMLLFLLLFFFLFGGAAVAAITFIPGFFKGEEVTVPDVRDMSYTEAYETIRDLGLTPKRQEEFHDEVEAGKVFQQDPLPNTVVKKKETTMVTLFVSKGKEKEPLEDYIGKDYETTKNIIEGSYEDVVWMGVSTADHPEGVIFEQSPEAGTMVVPENTSLILKYSTGQDTITIPNFTDWGVDQVRETLNLQDIELVTQEARYSDTIKEGYIIDQDPAPGTELAKGSQVKVVVSKGPEPRLEEKEKEKEQDDKKEKTEKKLETIKRIINLNVEIPESEEEKEYALKITYKDSTTSEGVLVEEEKITATKQFILPLEVKEGDKASYAVFINGEEVSTKSYTYDELKTIKKQEEGT